MLYYTNKTITAIRQRHRQRLTTLSDAATPILTAQAVPRPLLKHESRSPCLPVAAETPLCHGL